MSEKTEAYWRSTRLWRFEVTTRRYYAGTAATEVGRHCRTLYWESHRDNLTDAELDAIHEEMVRATRIAAITREMNGGSHE